MKFRCVIKHVKFIANNGTLQKMTSKAINNAQLSLKDPSDFHNYLFLKVIFLEKQKFCNILPDFHLLTLLHSPTDRPFETI